jgi:hypothetical protein
VATRGASHRRTGPAPDPEPTGALVRFRKTRAWQLLQPADRRRVIDHLRSNSSAMAVLIDDVFAAAALSRDEHPGSGDLWIGPELPINGMLIRDRHDGLWRIVQFDPDSTAHETWHTRGSA